MISQPEAVVGGRAPVVLEAAAVVRPLRVALLGFGVVGEAVARLLCERRELACHLQLTHVFSRNITHKRVSWTNDTVTWTDNIDEVFLSHPDVIVEVLGGLYPAADWVRRALAQQVSVVTANKLLMASHGRELLELAGALGCEIRFEASVAGCVPLINALQQGVAGDVITRVAGILNGTCNYVLSRMDTAGVSFEEALAEARRLGYAEADPTSDIEGADAAAKVVVLGGIAFNRQLRLADVATSSIASVTAVDFIYARRTHCTIRQISLLEARDRLLYAFVGPALVPDASPFASNVGPNNVIAVTGRYGGTTTYSGAGAGGPATAVAIVSDLLMLARRHGGAARVTWKQARIADDPARPFYVRFVVRDKPGILAAITAAFAHHGINVDAVLQEPGYVKDSLPFVVTVDACRESDLRQALAELSRHDHTVAPVVLPFFSELN